MERDFIFTRLGDSAVNWRSLAQHFIKLLSHIYFEVTLEVLACIFWVSHFIQVACDNNWHFKSPLTLITLKSRFILKQELCKGCVFNMLKSGKSFSSTDLSLSVTFNSNSECVSGKETKLLKLEKFWTLFKLEKGSSVIFYNLKSLIWLSSRTESRMFPYRRRRTAKIIRGNIRSTCEF